MRTGFLGAVVPCTVLWALAVSGASSTVHAATRYVSPPSAASVAASPFTSWKTAARDIESALDVAQDGDQIIVGPGVYRVRRTIVVQRDVEIRSAEGAAATVLDGRAAPADGWCFDIHASRAMVHGFTVTRFGGGVRFGHGEGTSAVVRNCVIARNRGHGLFFNHGGCAVNCTVVFNQGAGLYAYDMGSGGTDPANLILYGNERNYVGDSANIQLRSSSMGDPRFVAEDDYRLRADSPCIDCGQNQEWMDQAIDAAGNARVYNRVVDLGAYEYHASEQVGSTAKQRLSPRRSLAGRPWIDLLPLVQTGRDTRDCQWTVKGRSAVLAAGKPRAYVSIPLQVPPSYTVRVRMTVLRAKEVTAIYLPVTAGRAAVFGIRGDRGNSESPSATVEMRGLTPPPEAHRQPPIRIGKEYLVRCDVDRQGDQVSIELRLNGRPVYQWSGEVTRVAQQHLLQPGTIQLETAYYTMARFADFQLQPQHAEGSRPQAEGSRP